MKEQTSKVKPWMAEAVRTMYEDMDFPAAEAAVMSIQIAEAYEPEAKRVQALENALESISNILLGDNESIGDLVENLEFWDSSDYQNVLVESAKAAEAALDEYRKGKE